MTTATVREAIHERLDPVIEEIVTREISQRGGGYAGGLGEQARPFEALMPVLLSTILQQQRRPGGIQEPGQILQTLLPILPVVLPAILQQQRRPGGVQEPGQILQTLLPILPAVLPAILQQQRPGGIQQPGQILQALLPILPVLLPLLMQRGQAGQVSRAGQTNPLQTLAPALVAALSAC
jgi:hypothetical protein